MGVEVIADKIERYTDGVAYVVLQENEDQLILVRAKHSGAVTLEAWSSDYDQSFYEDRGPMELIVAIPLPSANTRERFVVGSVEKLEDIADTLRIAHERGASREQLEAAVAAMEFGEPGAWDDFLFSR